MSAVAADPERIRGRGQVILAVAFGGMAKTPGSVKTSTKVGLLAAIAFSSAGQTSFGSSMRIPVKPMAEIALR